MGVTLSDVAERAGVSRSAVSRTFTKGRSVSPEMRARVEAAARELGYRPNALAASLKTGRTGLVALVCDDFASAQTLSMQARLTRALEATGRQAVLFNLAGETDPETTLDRLRGHHVDGAVLVASDLDPATEDAIRAALPATIACLPPRGEGEASIDEFQAGRLAGRKLASRGYGAVGFVGGPRRSPATQRYLAGLTASIKGRGMPVTVQYSPSVSVQAGQRATRKLLARGVPEVLFCVDDLLALGALSALEEAGLSVPGDVGVLGVGDLSVAAWPQFGLSTLRPPKDAIAEAAVAMLAAVLEGEPRPEPRLFACKLMERRTLRPVPPSD